MSDAAKHTYSSDVSTHRYTLNTYTHLDVRRACTHKYTAPGRQRGCNFIALETVTCPICYQTVERAERDERAGTDKGAERDLIFLKTPTPNCTFE